MPAVTWTLPESFGGSWKRDQSAGVNERERQFLDRVDLASDQGQTISDASYGEYANGSAAVGVQRLVFPQEGTPEQTVRSFLAGAGIPDGRLQSTGSKDEALVCSDRVAEAVSDSIGCGYFVDGAVVVTVWTSSGLDLAGAGELTQELVSAATT